MPEEKWIKLSLTVFFIVIFFALRSITWYIVHNRGKRRNFSLVRIHNTSKFFTTIWLGLSATLIAIVWDVSIKGLSVYFASFFAAAGIALFAVWSILSNITSSVILFFNYTLKAGSRVKFVDGDNSITGTVKEITLFSIKIISDEGHIVSYPNNLALQRPIIQYQD